MGVIAPDKKPKRSRNSGTSGFAMFIMVFVLVTVPFLIIRSCTSSVPKQTVSGQPSVQSVKKTEPEAGIAVKDKKGLYELNGHPVLDAAGVLSSSEYNELDSYLMNLDRNTGVQIGVLTVENLDGEDISEFSVEQFEKWGLGSKDKDNGALLVVALEEHDVFICTGYGTEGALTDAKCARIIRNVIVPSFREGKYGEGIIQGVKNMAGVITADESLVSPKVAGEEDEEEETEVDAGEIFGFMVVIFMLFIIMIIQVITHAGRFGRRNHYGRVYMGPGPFTGMGGGHSSGSFHSGSSGGGFHGGGGHTGGGGAGGHW